MKCSIFCNTTPSAMLKANRYFGMICRLEKNVDATCLCWFIAWLILQPKIQAIRSSELPVCCQYTTRHHIPGDRSLHVYDKMKGTTVILNEEPEVRIWKDLKSSVRLIQMLTITTLGSIHCLLFYLRHTSEIWFSCSGFMFICRGAKVFIAPLPNKSRLFSIVTVFSHHVTK
jgi:hypothetical protein